MQKELQHMFEDKRKEIICSLLLKTFINACLVERDVSPWVPFVPAVTNLHFEDVLSIPRPSKVQRECMLNNNSVHDNPVQNHVIFFSKLDNKMLLN